MEHEGGSPFNYFFLLLCYFLSRYSHIDYTNQCFDFFFFDTTFKYVTLLVEYDMVTKY